jgi:hypothetical protein
LGLPGLDANCDGPCALVINGVDLTLTPHDGNSDDNDIANDETHAVNLRAHLGAVAPELPHELLASLLAGNLFSDAVDGHVLCMDLAGEVFIVRHLDRTHLQTPELLAALKRLAHHAGQWRDRWPRPSAPPLPMPAQATHHVP